MSEEKDVDLLDILSEEVENKKKEKADNPLNTDVDTVAEPSATVDDAYLEEEDDLEKKLQAIQDIANKHNTENISQSSGDIGQDLQDWLDGEDKLPTNGLTDYVGNIQTKMSYGLGYSTLKNYSLMEKAKNFINNAMDALFNEQAVLNLTSDELEDRLKIAFTIYERLNSLNNKTILALTEQKRKYHEDDGVDRLSLLLSSIPSDKLEKILRKLAWSDSDKA